MYSHKKDPQIHVILHLKVGLYFRTKVTNLKIYQRFKKFYKCYYIDTTNLLPFLLCHLKDKINS